MLNLIRKFIFVPEGPLQRNTLIYYFSDFCHSLIFTIPIWIVYYQAKISVAEISLLLTIQYVVQMILELPSGAIADMLGRKKTVFLAFLIGAIGLLLFPFAQNFWHFFILALLAGTSDSFRSGAEEALIYDSYKEKNQEDKIGKVYADENLVYQIGIIISTALGGLIFSFNHDLPYILYGIALLIGALLTWFYIEPKIDSEKFNLKNYANQIKFGSKEAFKDDYTKYLSLFYIFVGGIAWSSTIYFNGFMLIDLGFSDDLRGYLDAGLRVINVFVIKRFLRNANIFNWKRTILFFPIIMLTAYLPSFLLSGFWGLPFIQAAMIATTARWSILAPLTNQVFSSKYRATAISFLSLMIGFVYIALTGTSGFVIENYGIRTMYMILGIVSLVTVVPISIKLLFVGRKRI